MTRFTATEFRNRFLHEPEVKLLQTEVEENFINDVCEQVINYLRSQSPSFAEDRLSEWQTNQLKLIQMEQALYVLQNGRLDRSPAIDSFGNEVSNTSFMSPVAIQIAKRSGFFYKGL